jgi:pSer/pThr/pTyr-binding forkhead associated (FHA) protein
MSVAAKLIPKDAFVAFDEIPLTQLPLRMGRSVDADVCVDDRWVSREHCQIDEADGELTVRDLGSKHGTFVNGRAVSLAELRPGDELSIGLSRFIVRTENNGGELVLRRGVGVPR